MTLIEALINIYQSQCQYCGRSFTKDDLRIEHIIPRAKNGEDAYENITLACHPCNTKKGALILREPGISLLLAIAEKNAPRIKRRLEEARKRRAQRSQKPISPPEPPPFSVQLEGYIITFGRKPDPLTCRLLLEIHEYLCIFDSPPESVCFRGPDGREICRPYDVSKDGQFNLSGICPDLFFEDLANHHGISKKEIAHQVNLLHPIIAESPRHSVHSFLNYIRTYDSSSNTIMEISISIGRHLLPILEWALMMAEPIAPLPNLYMRAHKWNEQVPGAAEILSKSAEFLANLINSPQ